MQVGSFILHRSRDSDANFWVCNRKVNKIERATAPPAIHPPDPLWRLLPEQQPAEVSSEALLIVTWSTPPVLNTNPACIKLVNRLKSSYIAAFNNREL